MKTQHPIIPQKTPSPYLFARTSRSAFHLDIGHSLLDIGYSILPLPFLQNLFEVFRLHAVGFSAHVAKDLHRLGLVEHGAEVVCR